MALSLNGTTQYGYISNMGYSMGASTGCTISFWFRPRTTATMSLLFLHIDPTTGLNTASKRVLYTAGTSVSMRNQNYNTWASAAGVNVGQWNHIMCGWFQSSSRWVRINMGTVAHHTAAQLTASPTSMTVGALYYSSTINTYLDGEIAELGMWNYNGLNDGDMHKALYNGTPPFHVRPASIMAYYPLTGKLDPEHDQIRGYNLPLYNSPTSSNHPRIIRPSANKRYYLSGGFVPVPRLPKSGAVSLSNTFLIR